MSPFYKQFDRSLWKSHFYFYSVLDISETQGFAHFHAWNTIIDNERTANSNSDKFQIHLNKIFNMDNYRSRLQDRTYVYLFYG